MLNHNHDHHPQPTDRKGTWTLGLLLTISLSYMVLEIVFSFISGSLALLSDAGHMATDSFALIIALVAGILSQRPADQYASYGYHRVEILAAFINGMLLIGICGFIIIEATERAINPTDVDSESMMAVAVGGLLLNIIAGVALFKQQKNSLNLKGAFYHIVSDGLGSVAVIGAGVVIMATGWMLADTIASMLIAVLIFFAGLHLIRQATRILLDGTPSELEMNSIRNSLSADPDVSDIHDLHVWVIKPGYLSLTAHVVPVNDCGSQCDLLDRLLTVLENEFKINHVTIQMEPHCQNTDAAHS